MATDKQASNSGADMSEIAAILAKVLTARDPEATDYRTALAKAAGTGIAKDQIDGILAKAKFDTEHLGNRAAVTINAVRYSLFLGAKGWQEIADAAKKAIEDSKATDAVLGGNWTTVANAIAKRRMDEGMTFDAAKSAAINAAKKNAKIDIAKAKFRTAAANLRKVQADLIAGLEDVKLKAKIESALATLEKAGA